MSAFCSGGLRAYRFLSKIKSLPGQTGRELDGVEFEKWVLEARELCSEEKVLDEFNQVFGRILAYSPFDQEDGAWPHKSVRKFIEKFPSRDIKSALNTGLFNKRGIVTKACFEGGSKERNLAEKYQEWAKKIQVLYPETSSVLESLASQYFQMAKHADERAEFDKIKGY